MDQVIDLMGRIHLNDEPLNCHSATQCTSMAVQMLYMFDGGWFPPFKRLGDSFYTDIGTEDHFQSDTRSVTDTCTRGIFQNNTPEKMTVTVNCFAIVCIHRHIIIISTEQWKPNEINGFHVFHAVKLSTDLQEILHKHISYTKISKKPKQVKKPDCEIGLTLWRTRGKFGRRNLRCYDSGKCFYSRKCSGIYSAPWIHYLPKSMRV